jgi:cyclic pyranopterin phosphate synthase
MPREIFGKGYQFLNQNQLLSFEEITRLVRLFASFGVCKLRLTGGEPLLRRQIDKLVSMLAEVDGIGDIAMTTNASLLTRERVRDLYAAGLDRLNISLDALDPAVYAHINEVNTPLEDVLQGIENSLAADFASVKINMVVQKGVNEGEILPMVERFRHSGAILRFIEFMDVGNHNQWTLQQVFSAGEIVQLIDRTHPLEPLEPNYHGEVASRWRFRDGGGEIGVISSISQPFCRDCSRARLSAIGELYTCLFATSGFDLRSLVRTGYPDDVIAGKMADIWRMRNDRYSEERFHGNGSSPESGSRSAKVEMSYIGG